MNLNIMTNTGIESRDVSFRIDYKDLDFFVFVHDGQLVVTETSSGHKFAFFNSHSVENVRDGIAEKIESLGYDKVLLSFKTAIEKNGRAN